MGDSVNRRKQEQIFVSYGGPHPAKTSPSAVNRQGPLKTDTPKIQRDDALQHE